MVFAAVWRQCLLASEFLMMADAALSVVARNASFAWEELLCIGVAMPVDASQKHQAAAHNAEVVAVAPRSAIWDIVHGES
jgi:hypothetical protein